jgi:hypothetical protein
VRILRHLLMMLALLSMVGHPASAATNLHGQTVSLHAAHQHQHHHHHDADVAGVGHLEGSAVREHHCPSHHRDGTCCDSACCASNCLAVSMEPIFGSSVHIRVAKIRAPVGDSRPNGTIPFLPVRPPITT